MALITCPDCGKQVSDSAPTCPSCGRPVAGPRTVVDGRSEGLFMKSLNFGCVVIIAIILAIVVIVLAAKMFGI